jgi:hypothetical protein
MPESLSVDGLRATPLMVGVFFVADPVVTPGFVLDLVASGPTLPWLDAPVAGWVCAGAIAVAPNNAATTRAETASLDRMAISSLDLLMVMRG